MLAVNGYYDGVEIKPLEKMDIKQGQKVIITILNDFVKPEQISKTRNAWCSCQIRGSGTAEKGERRVGTCSGGKI